MQESSEQNRSEAPTHFKLQKARQRGAIARGMDLGFLTGLAALLGYLWVMGPQLAGQLRYAARTAIVAAPNVAIGQHEILAVTAGLMSTMLRPMAFLAATVFLVVLVFEIVQIGGFVFTTEPLKLDFSRLNPAKGLKRIFSVRLLIETAKNVLKLIVYAGVAYIAIRGAHDRAIPAVTDADSLAQALARTGLRLLVAFVGVALLFAALDQLIARRDFLKKMRMSRREVKREHKDREGDPRIKQKRKELHREFARLSKSLKNVRGADVLITNPIHYAVALKYDAKAMGAPTVVSRGADRLALRLKRMAFVYGVVIVENRELARALYHRCDLDQQIPDAYFKPVADIYKSVRAKKATRGARAAHA